VRLNNPVNTTFRTLLRDYTFDEKHSFKKGTQFLIANNPVLREKEFFDKPNQFIPERWTPEMEKSYYAISFNQGPQRCPGKELVIFLCQSFLYNFVKLKKIDHNTQIDTIEIDTNYIPQIINPCTIYFTFGSNK
jgi:cytochrome P450